MLKELLTGEDLLALQQEKGNICVSIIVPTHRLSPGRRADREELEKAIGRARQLLQSRYGEEESKPLLGALDELFGTIDFVHNQDGIGLFVSPNIKLAVAFPFPVEEKVMAGNDFEIRDLLYKVNFAIPYHVLMLTEQGARFFEGRWKGLSEIKDNYFPIKYEDDFVYSKPVRSSSYAGHAHVKIYEKDKSELETIRWTDFFRTVDKRLDHYLVDNTPMVVAAVEKELSHFYRVSRHKKSIVGEIKGDYDHSNEMELAEMAWPKVHGHLQDFRVQLVKDFEEKVGADLGVSGIEEVWEAAQEGKALKLLVEKDYRVPGFVIRNDAHLYLRPPTKLHTVLADAVDDLIDLVLEKNGQVYFTDNGLLKDHQRIALIKRY